MINRIIDIRKQSGCNQEQFATKLNLSRNFISQVESGKKNISDRTISDICREFNVNEEWLRTGQGEMHNLASDKLETYLGQISRGNDDFIKDIIEIYMELDQPSKDALKEISLRMAIKVKEREGK